MTRKSYAELCARLDTVIARLDQMEMDAFTGSVVWSYEQDERHLALTDERDALQEWMTDHPDHIYA